VVAQMGTWPADWLAAGLKMAMARPGADHRPGGEWRSSCTGNL